MKLRGTLVMNFARFRHGEGRELARDIAQYAENGFAKHVVRYAHSYSGFGDTSRDVICCLLAFRWRMWRIIGGKHMPAYVFYTNSASVLRQMLECRRAKKTKTLLRELLQHRSLDGSASFQLYRELLQWGFNRRDIDVEYIIRRAASRRNVALLRHLRDYWGITSEDALHGVGGGDDKEFALRILSRSTKK